MKPTLQKRPLCAGPALAVCAATTVASAGDREFGHPGRSATAAIRRLAAHILAPAWTAWAARPLDPHQPSNCQYRPSPDRGRRGTLPSYAAATHASSDFARAANAPSANGASEIPSFSAATLRAGRRAVVLGPGSIPAAMSAVSVQISRAPRVAAMRTVGFRLPIICVSSAIAPRSACRPARRIIHSEHCARVASCPTAGAALHQTSTYCGAIDLQCGAACDLRPSRTIDFDRPLMTNA